jgi:hypothetical protein
MLEIIKAATIIEKIIKFRNTIQDHRSTIQSISIVAHSLYQSIFMIYSDEHFSQE